jgi:restriction endonuclease S subunit
MAALVVRDEQQLLPKFLYYYLLRHKDEKLVTLMAGTANTSLTLSDLENVEIEFPSLETQREIVVELDRMQSESVRVSTDAQVAAEESREVFIDAVHSLL